MAEAGQQVRGQGHNLSPGHVDCLVPRWPPVQAKVLGLLDVVLDVDVGAVAGVQPGDLPAAGISGHELIAAPELLFPFGGLLALARVQRLVPPDNPQAGIFFCQAPRSSGPVRSATNVSSARSPSWPIPAVQAARVPAR